MKHVKITVLARHEYRDLIKALELPQSDPCPYMIGSTWISQDAQQPTGFCQSAWMNVQPYVFALANGTEEFFGGWMKKKGTALISCNDGFRPVSFLLEAIDSCKED